MAEKSGADLPEQWTHTPRKVLRFQPGSRIADLDTDTSPGFDGSRQDAEAVLADRSERFAGLQEMLYANGKAATAGRCCWCCRAWTPRARAASSSM